MESSAKVTLKELPYALNGLEPVISEHLMTFHYSKHHATYVNNFNKLLEQKDAAEAAGDFHKVTQLTRGLKFNGGGNFNHTFYWESLAPVAENGGKAPTEGPLKEAIDASFGSIDEMIAFFNAESATI